MARDFPRLKIVVSHGCYPWVGDIIMVVQRNRNVYLELSEYEQSPFSEGYIQAANTMIGDKVIFRQRPPLPRFQGTDRALQEAAVQPAGAGKHFLQQRRPIAGALRAEGGLSAVRGSPPRLRPGVPGRERLQQPSWGWETRGET
ncbi:MAG: amidohydrolase family protein [Bilophila sp.]